MAERKQKRYFRLTRSERASIERELGKRRPSARDVARDLGRSPASISDEAKRNRTVARGPGINTIPDSRKVKWVLDVDPIEG